MCIKGQMQGYSMNMYNQDISGARIIEKVIG